MEHSGTTKIFVIVWASTLFASYVTGICIKEVRFKRARVATQAVTEPEVSSEVQKPSETDKLVSELAQKSPMSGPGGAERPGNRSPEDSAGFGEGRRNMRGFANMSEEERAQMRERIGSRRREGGQRFQNLSEEERARMEEQRRQMRERMENMSEEERAKMGEEMEELRGRWEEMSEEEREEARAQMNEKYGFVPRIGIGGRPGGGAGGRRQPSGRRQENN
jgi:uncharacterized protein with von Willebrand factor type A (vWA) domain